MAPPRKPRPMTSAQEKAITGRKLKPIDEAQVREMAMYQCTLEEMSSNLGCHRETLSLRFSDIIKEGWEYGKKSLRRRMYEKAMTGDTGMLVWLSKQYLGFRDKQLDENVQTVINVAITEVPK